MKHCSKALILYKNNIQYDRRTKKNVHEKALILYKNNIQFKFDHNKCMYAATQR